MDVRGATKGKIWRDAIRRAVNGDSTTLDELAMKLVSIAREGDGNASIVALKEIGDRLDGKPKQQIEASGTDGGPLMVQVVRFTDYLADDPAAK